MLISSPDREVREDFTS